MTRPIRLLAVTLLLAACAGPAPRPDCSGADLAAAADAALEGGMAPGPESLTCAVAAGELERVWEEAACAPGGTWRIGLAGGPFPGACKDRRELLEGHRLGREYARVLEQLRPLPDAGAVDPAQVRLIRERDVIRGIAQLRGWTLPEDPERP